MLILGAILRDERARAVGGARASWSATCCARTGCSAQAQYDTIITSGFIHGDFGHLLFNSLTFYFFAPALEQRIGTARFVALYFIGLVAEQPRHGLQAAQQSRLRGARRVGRHPRGAVRLHRLLPEADALPVLRDPDSRGAVRVRLRRLQLVGFEAQARQHQPRCASRRRVHRARSSSGSPTSRRGAARCTRSFG